MKLSCQEKLHMGSHSSLTKPRPWDGTSYQCSQKNCRMSTFLSFLITLPTT